MKLILLVALFSFPALAADEGNSSRLSWANITEKVDASYAALFLGPTVEHFDGNIDGKGKYQSLRHYLAFDAEVARDWKAESGWEIRQYWRPVDPKNTARQEFEPRDPYLGLARKNLYRGEYFTFSTKARYYLPLTTHNKTKVGKPEDFGHGEANLGLSPSWRFLDGDLFVGLGVDLYYRFDKNAPAVRENYAVKAKPLVTYRLARRFAAKVEYNSGTLRHSTNGKWSKFNDRFNGQKLYVGGTWSPTDRLAIGPSLGWGSHTFRLRGTELSVYASYNFL